MCFVLSVSALMQVDLVQLNVTERNSPVFFADWILTVSSLLVIYNVHL